MTFNADSSPGESGTRISPTAFGTQHVELWGIMPIGWLGNFTRGAARLKLDIVRGTARRDSERRWLAEFELLVPAETDLAQIDFLALARDPSPSAAAIALELRSFELKRPSDPRGTLELRIRARDRVGFLASLLEHLAGFVLFPEEISIDTWHREALDALLLSSVGGQSPPPELEGALRASLESCRRNRPSLLPSE